MVLVTPGQRKSELTDVTNADFLQVISRNLILADLDPCLDPSVHLWSTAFEGDPNGDRALWNGAPVPIANGVFAPNESRTANTFYVVSVLTRPTPGPSGIPQPPRRVRSQFAAGMVLVVDDVGSKLPWDQVDDAIERLGGRCSYSLETSPGNYQVGFVLARPETDIDRFEALQRGVMTALVGPDGKDPGMLGAVRYVRLPVGSNAKEKYRRDDGTYPAHVLHHWDPTADFTIVELESAFGFEAEKLTKRRATVQGAARFGETDDPWLPVLGDAGLLLDGHVKDKGADGLWVDVLCPWVDGHTGGDPSGSAYGLGGHFKCHHGSCAERNGRDLTRFLLEHDDPAIRSKAAMARADAAFGGIGKAAETFDRHFAEAEARGEPLELVTQETAPHVLPRRITFEEALSKAAALTPGEDSVNLSALSALIDEIGAAGLRKEEVSLLVERIKEATMIPKGDLKAAIKDASRKFAAALRGNAALSGDASLRARAEFVSRMLGTGKGKAPVLQLMPGGPDEPPRAIMHQGNLGTILEHGLGTVYPAVRLNRQIDLEEITVDGVTEVLSDHHVTRIIEMVSLDFRSVIPVPPFHSALSAVAASRAYSPLVDYLNQAAWDGTQRLDQWLPRVTGAEDNEYHRAVGRVLLLGIVWRTLFPGCKYDHVVILSGREGSRKSTLLKRLAVFGQAYAEVAIDLRAVTNTVAAFYSASVVEIGELAGMRGTDSEMLKQIISRTHDNYRPPYGRKVVQGARNFVLVGTTNRGEAILESLYGNRRFLPVRCGEGDMDLAYLDDATLEQLYAEAVAACRAGELPMLPPHVETLAKQVQAEMTDDQDEAIRDAIEDLLDAQLAAQVAKYAAEPTTDHKEEARRLSLLREQLTSSKSIHDALGIPILEAKKYARAIGRVMTGLGFVKVRMQRGGARERGWARQL